MTAIEPAGPGHFRVDVAIAAQTIGANPVQFINMVFGNASLWDDVQFTGLDVPLDVLALFPGPRHGIAGIRRLLEAPERPLTNAAMKPQGLHVRELAALCRTFALAGVDIVKDDHGIDDQHYSPFAERVRACQAAIAEAVAATGRPALYAPNLIGTPRVLRERARIAREEGVRAVLIAPMLVGLPAFFDLVEEFPDFVYLAHPSFGGARSHRAGVSVRPAAASLRQRRRDLRERRRPLRLHARDVRGTRGRRACAVGIAPAGAAGARRRHAVGAHRGAVGLLRTRHDAADRRQLIDRPRARTSSVRASSSTALQRTVFRRGNTC